MASCQMSRGIVAVTLNTPLARRLCLHLQNSGFRVFHTHFVEDDGGFHIEQVMTPPFEFDSRVVFVFVAFPLDGNVNIPKRFWRKRLDLFPLIYHESKRRELARSLYHERHTNERWYSLP